MWNVLTKWNLGFFVFVFCMASMFWSVLRPFRELNLKFPFRGPCKGFNEVTAFCLERLQKPSLSFQFNHWKKSETFFSFPSFQRGKITLEFWNLEPNKKIIFNLPSPLNWIFGFCSAKFHNIHKFFIRFLAGQRCSQKLRFWKRIERSLPYFVITNRLVVG